MIISKFYTVNFSIVFIFLNNVKYFKYFISTLKCNVKNNGDHFKKNLKYEKIVIIQFRFLNKNVILLPTCIKLFKIYFFKYT